jgi:hypothetical protein
MSCGGEEEGEAGQQQSRPWIWPNRIQWRWQSKTSALLQALVLNVSMKSVGSYTIRNPLQQQQSILIGLTIEGSTDYAVNVLYVISFTSLWEGGTEAARLLGLLGLPNDTTMKSWSFTIIENRIGPIIRTLGKEVILDNLIKEARLSMEASSTQQDVHDFSLWKTSLTDKSIKLSRLKMPKIDGSYEMAW